MKLRARFVDNKRGVTFVELLIVVGITILFALLASPLYGNFYVETQLDETHQQVLETLRLARGRSRAGLNNKAHGVHFEITPAGAMEYTLYQGTPYALRDVLYDRKITIERVIRVTTTLSGGDISFTPDGIPSGTGIVTFKHESGETRTLNINAGGIANE